MSTTKPKPRRVREPGSKNHNIYRRADGRLEIGYRDSTGKQRWRGPFDTVTQARGARDRILGDKASGKVVQPNPRLRFGEASMRWLGEQVVDLRETTQANYENSVRIHLRPRWGNRRLDAITVDDAAKLVRELRAEGKAESTIATILRAASRVFKFARRRCGWHGENPIGLLEAGERARVSDTPERRIYTRDELAQTLVASTEPWATLFRLASVVGGRESELLAIWWSELDLSDLDAASIAFSHQVDRKGRRVELKTEESKAMLPLPRSTAVMLLEHKARSAHVGPQAFVFSTASGRPLGQRNVLRALHRAQQHARNADGTPTFSELFAHDARGHLVVDDDGRYVPNDRPRRELPPLPDFHALRHTAAMDCDDAEEARDLLRHKNSNVTRAIYRAHFSQERRDALRVKLEARHGAGTAPATPRPPEPERDVAVLRISRASA